MKDLIKLLGLKTDATETDVVDAVKKLHGELAALKEADKQRAADEKIIAEKMLRGLSRQQAIQVIQRQREFDAKKAEAAKAAKAKEAKK